MSRGVLSSILLSFSLPFACAFRLLSSRQYRFHAYQVTVMNTEWSQVKVKFNERDGEGLRNIIIETTPDICNLYKIPGQYVQIRKNADSKPGFYAIANPPTIDATTFSFIVKEAENNAQFTSADVGSVLEMSNPQGKGFLMQEYFDKYKFEYPTSQVIMMACGTGLAPIAAAIESEALGLQQKNFNSLYERKAVLYIGARTESRLPLRHKYADWEQRGVKVIPVLSQPEPSWSGRTGYIQDALRKDAVGVPMNTGALLCGQRGMVDSARELLLEAGVFEGRVLLNF